MDMRVRGKLRSRQILQTKYWFWSYIDGVSGNPGITAIEIP